MLIYRVCTLSDLDERIEAKTGAICPGWRNSRTGFWSVKVECAKAILRSRDEAAFNHDGGGSWSKILVTERSNVKEKDITPDMKEGDNPLFDDGEIFVTKIIDAAEVKCL